MLAQAIPQTSVPFQLVFVGWRADRLSVRRVNAKYAHVADRGCNHPRLRIFFFVAKRRPHFARLGFGENGDAVVRLLSVKRGVITGRRAARSRELLIRAFRLLQANDVGLVSASQASSRSCRLRSELMFQETIFTAGGLREAVKLPVFDREANSFPYNSISSPGGGTITSDSRQRRRGCARTHSTAGSSPCTSTTFRGATFFM